MQTRSVTFYRDFLVLAEDMKNMREQLHMQHKSFQATYIVLEEQEKKINQLRDELLYAEKKVDTLQEKVDHLQDLQAKHEIMQRADDAAMFNRVQALSQDVADLTNAVETFRKNAMPKHEEEVVFVR